MSAPRKAVVTGGRGYLGSLVTRQLAEHGWSVHTVDNGLTSRQRITQPNVWHVDADVRDIGDWRGLLAGVDAVVHLAAVVGDPACDVDHDLAWETNYLATVRLAEACRAAETGRLVMASTCSTYGTSEEEPAGTGAPVRPRSVYALTKVHAEHHLLSQWQPGRAPCILRFATLYGLSPRMRFDLAVNLMTAQAVKEGRLCVYGGAQWRPFLHVADASAAVLASLVSGDPALPSIYNCGSDADNHRLIDVGRIIAREAGNDPELIVEPGNDERDYRVDFAPIRAELGFRPRYDLVSGVREIVAAIRGGHFPDYSAPAYSDYRLVRDAVAAEVPNATVRAPTTPVA